MKVEQYQYLKDVGWVKDHFRHLDSENTLVVVFGSPTFDQDAPEFKEISEAYPNSKIIGCSSAGEIFENNICDFSLSIAVAKFSDTVVQTYYKEIPSADLSQKVGEEISNELSREDLKSLLILSDGININGSNLVKGLKKNVSKEVIITGGLAGDGKDFKKTWLFNKNEVVHNGVIAVGLYGDKVKVNFASKGGWDIFGPKREITRSVDNVVYEIDHQPALTLYKKYLGSQADELPSSGLLYPLEIRETPDSAPLVRTILNVNEEEKSLIFAGDVPEGWQSQLMRANFERLVDGASKAANDMLEMNSKTNDIGDSMVLAISCVGRRLVLGERCEEETEVVWESLPKHSKMIGFYSYGEISPTSCLDCDLHNQTMTLTQIYESK